MQDIDPAGFLISTTSFGVQKNQGQLFSHKTVLSALCNTEHIKHIRVTACQNTRVSLSSPISRRWRYMLGYHQYPRRNSVHVSSLSLLAALFILSWEGWRRRIQLPSRWESQWGRRRMPQYKSLRRTKPVLTTQATSQGQSVVSVLVCTTAFPGDGSFHSKYCRCWARPEKAASHSSGHLSFRYLYTLIAQDKKSRKNESKRLQKHTVKL